ncbi:SDR family oxidoreductase [Sphingobacterium sp. SYP-B4668]|uniref:SDR family oxidoreductase n=1 Tax=Sphingobacterium sp. SYP-B4668 TaxID=2996035 RepID=UPI0022DE8AC9|nr:SDR family oxidoreductase [Sphingobacterium sp. SYP-B4668]
MNITLTDKVAMVGGATSGIGEAIAIQLASSGASLVLVARNESKLKNTLTRLDVSQGQEHRYLVVDFADFGHAQLIIKEFFENNSIDIVVNNTNGPSAGGIKDKTIADYQQAFDLLFQYAVSTTLLAIPHMVKQGFGRIINVSSLTVKEPQDTLILSNTMRTALVSWSKSLSRDVAPNGVTVNTVLTGYFNTDRLNKLMETQAEQLDVSVEDIRDKRISSIPMKRLGRPEEYAYLVTFLASDYAAYLTGTSLQLDGGLMTGLF